MMNFDEINPFVRYAGKIQLSSTPLRIARDHRIFYVASGEVKFEIAGTEQSIASKMLIYIPSGTPYRMLSAEKCELYVLNFDFTQKDNKRKTALPTVEEKTFQTLGRLEEKLFENGYFSEPMFVVGNIFEQKINSLISEFTLKKIFFYEKSSAILKEILFDLLRLFYTETSGENSAVDMMISYIQENYMHPITNRDIASVVRYHEYHANRLMLRHTGTTIHKYLNNFRIERAKIYLTTTKLPVGDVAEKTGLGSVSRFSESFKKTTGVSPATYRKENYRLI